MRFLVDLLAKGGHDAVHVRDLEAAGATDSAIMTLAVADERIIISADTDFGALLAHSRATKPSVILVRALVDRRPPELAGIIIANPGVLEEHLRSGAIAAFTQSDIRVRALPLR
jgi:predicted nuclease of predicted toxin-antitoxin system